MHCLCLILKLYLYLQALVSSVKGIVMSVQSRAVGRGPLEASAAGGALEEGPPLSAQCIYIETGRSSTGGREQEAYIQFARSDISAHCRTSDFRACFSLI